MKKTFLKLLAFASVVALAGCDGARTSSGSTLQPSDINTAQTDVMEIRADYQGKSFIADGIGIARLVSNTDGDTTNFAVGTPGVDYQRITIRYNAIDTPESTGRIEAWGVKASKFVKDILETAHLIVLDNEKDIYDTVDGNGRYLGFVWYQATATSKLRMLNLELVELAYSKEYMYETESAYFDYFKTGGEHAAACGAKVYGETDPDFDPGVETYSITIAELRKNYDQYGTTDESSGTILLIEALVVGMIGDNMVLRDLDPDPNKTDGSYAGIYAFAAYGSTLASFVKVGYIVKFYCSAAKFLGNMQLSNLNTKTTGVRKFELVAKNVTGPIEGYENINVAPTIITAASATKGILGQRVGDYVETTVTVRQIQTGDYDENGEIISGTGYTSYYRKDAKKNMTIYAKLNSSLVFNLRIDGTSYPYPGHELFAVGKTYRVRGYLAPYHDNYQLQMFNNLAAHENIVEIVA